MSDNMKELLAINRDYFTPAEVAKVLCCDPQAIRFKARYAPDTLGFPTLLWGTRVKIPRIPFLKSLGIEETEIKTLYIKPKSNIKQK